MADAIERDLANPKQPGQNSSTYERAAELRAGGLSYAEIGRRLGVSKQRIFSVLNGNPRAPARLIPSPESKTVLSTREAAYVLGVHVNTVRRWAAAGTLKSFRVGPRGDRRFERSVLKEFLGSLGSGKDHTDPLPTGADQRSHANELP